MPDCAITGSGRCIMTKDTETRTTDRELKDVTGGCARREFIGFEQSDDPSQTHEVDKPGPELIVDPVPG